LAAEHLILKPRHLFGCGTPDFKVPPLVWLRNT